MSAAIARIGVQTVRIEQLPAGAVIDILESADIRMAFTVIEPTLRLIELVGMNRTGRGIRPAAIAPSEAAYLAPGTRLIPCAFADPRAPNIIYPDGPLTVGATAGFEILGDELRRFGIATIKRIVIHE